MKFEMFNTMLKKRCLLFVFYFISFTGNAQGDPLSISANIGYGFSNQLEFNGYTELRSAYNAGIEVRKQVGQKGLYLQTGVRWNEYGYRYIYQTVDWSSGFAELVDVDYRSTSFFLTIPLIATYKLKAGIPGLTFSAGPQISYYVTTKRRLNGELSYVSGNQSAFNLGAHVSTGYERKIAENWILGGELYTNFNFPIGETYASQNVFNFGIGFTGRYILKSTK